MSPRIGSLFSGYGGLDLALLDFIDGDVAWHVELDDAASVVLGHHWPEAGNYGDITTVKWTPDCPRCGDPTALYRTGLEDELGYYCPAHGWFELTIRLDDPDADRIPEPVEVLCGGFPCQDLSTAGRRRGMRPGTRSGLWSDFLLAIKGLRPSLVVIENVKGLLSGCAESEIDSDLGPCPRCLDPDSGADHAPNLRALGRVLGDLASLGYDTRWIGLRASDAGATHERYRVVVAAFHAGVGLEATVESLRARAATAPYTQRDGGERRGDPRDVGDAEGSRRGEGDQRQRDGVAADGGGAIDWAEYREAVELWETVLGRPAPAPTDGLANNGAALISPRFEEWMMGLPAGHVTDPQLWLDVDDRAARKAQLKMLGNGVVPQQVALALYLMLQPGAIAA